MAERWSSGKIVVLTLLAFAALVAAGRALMNRSMNWSEPPATTTQP